MLIALGFLLKKIYKIFFFWKNRTGEGCYARTPIFDPVLKSRREFLELNIMRAERSDLHVSRVYARVTWARRMGNYLIPPRYAGSELIR
jgi:hypothetical protein